jgi:hypothetical protein
MDYCGLTSRILRWQLMWMILFDSNRQQSRHEDPRQLIACINVCLRNAWAIKCCSTSLSDLFSLGKFPEFKNRL